MSDETEERLRYAQLAKDNKAQKPAAKKVKVWQLVFGPAEERIVHGAYSLCQSYKNKHKTDQRYKIIPFKN